MDRLTARPPAAKNDIGDITPRVVEQQLAAMACEYYDILAIDHESGAVKMNKDCLASHQVMRLVPALRANNAHDCHIYVRPHGAVGLVLVDDVTPDALSEMTAQGLEPALVVITSPSNYQAWVRLSWASLPVSLKTAAARELARRFGGDPAAASWRQCGRLAGFTNRKRRYRMVDGRHPYVRLLQRKGEMAGMGATLLEACQARLITGTSPDELPEGFSAGSAGRRELLRDEYKRRVKQHLGRYADVDYSRMDYMLGCALLSAHPDATSTDLAWAIVYGSPNVHTRHKDDVWGYARRTADAVLRERDKSRLGG